MLPGRAISPTLLPDWGAAALAEASGLDPIPAQQSEPEAQALPHQDAWRLRSNSVVVSLNLIKCAEFLFNKRDEINQNIKNCSKKNLNNIYKELYKRFIIPIYIPLLVLITFILILTSKENLNYSKIKTLTFSLGLFVIIFSETTIRLISEIILKNFLISLIPLVFLLTLYLIFFSKTNHRYKVS